jgi:lipopolysaccharide heptosyltransferase III
VGSVLDRLPRNSAVAILRLRSLGDCVLTTPALDILQHARPDLRIAVMVEDRFREIFEGLVPTLPPRLGELRKWKPRLCLNLHGGTPSAWMTALSGAGLRAGFGHFRHQSVYNVRIPRAQEILQVERKVHTAEHIASAMFALGAPVEEIPRARLVVTAAPSRSGARAILHPVAATPAKTWRPDGFLEVAAHLKRTGIEPVFIGAQSDDLSAFQSYRVVQGSPLSDVKALLSTAALFVGNDSGPAHIAAAFGVPVIAIFGASDPDIWGPWRTPSEVVTSPGGIAHIETGQVLEALTRLRVHA